MRSPIRIGIIGGSGVYQIEQLQDVEEVTLDTPFGAPSDAYILGTLAGQRVAFLPRHGRGHRVSPSRLNYRANIYGFKMLGVEYLIGVSACGSLREHIEPGDIVIPDQLFDRTHGRSGSFFDDPSVGTAGLVVHVSVADPFCPVTQRHLLSCRQRDRQSDPQRWCVCYHRGAALQHRSRKPRLPHLGPRHRRHDHHPGSATGARGRNELCRHGPRDRLRRLAREQEAGHRRDGGENTAAQCRGGQSSSRQRHHTLERCWPVAAGPCLARCPHHQPRGRAARRGQQATPVVGQILCITASQHLHEPNICAKLGGCRLMTEVLRRV